MGILVDGKWQQDARLSDSAGRFVRTPTSFRSWITPDGSAGPTGETGFTAEPGRYHLYVSLACPWAHRTVIFRKLKDLSGVIGVSVVHWLMRENGWTFTPGPGVIPDPVFGARFLHEVYTAASPHYTGRVTVPVLLDRKTRRIVNNESAEIIRMFNSAFDRVGAAPGDYYPPELRGEIDGCNQRIYETLNNGVYRAGFASTQTAYEEAVAEVFATLDWLDARLANQSFLCGDRLTEADVRLFTTLIRFDPVYHGHFKCNLRRIVDYQHVSRYLQQLYNLPGIADTVDFHHIKHHYYESHTQINPTGIVPAGPIMELGAPEAFEPVRPIIPKR